MPNAFDYSLVTLFAAAWPLYAYFVQWPAHVRRVAAGEPMARIRMFRGTIIEQWGLSVLLAVLWVAYDRSPGELFLRAPEGWRLWPALLLPLFYAVLMARQMPAVVRSEPTRAYLRSRLQPLRALLPHRAAEWRWFVPLAVTAGCCEELLFRGYLVWVLEPWLGLYGAAAVSAAVFGLAHGYQGSRYGLRAFAAGCMLGAFALVTGSIVPGIVLHALIDLGSGYVCYLSLREPEVPAGLRA